jgi:hypothetical protein
MLIAATPSPHGVGPSQCLSANLVTFGTVQVFCIVAHSSPQKDPLHFVGFGLTSK